MSEPDISLPLRTEEFEETIADRTRRFYDNLADIYAVSSHLFHAKAHKWALEQSGIQNGMNVLEVAAGSGEVFRKLLERNRDGLTVATDLAPKMAAQTLKEVRKHAPWSRAYCGATDVRDLPFRDAAFDSVVCCYLLELLGTADIFRTLREIRRVLKPGGKLTLIVIGQNKRMFNKAYILGATVLPQFWGRQMEASTTPLLKEIGFDIKADRYIQQLWYPSRVLVAENPLEPELAIPAEAKQASV